MAHLLFFLFPFHHCHALTLQKKDKPLKNSGFYCDKFHLMTLTCSLFSFSQRMLCLWGRRQQSVRIKLTVSPHALPIHVAIIHLISFHYIWVSELKFRSEIVSGCMLTHIFKLECEVRLFLSRSKYALTLLFEN